VGFKIEEFIVFKGAESSINAQFQVVEQVVDGLDSFRDRQRGLTLRRYSKELDVGHRFSSVNRIGNSIRDLPNL
jgi:hypothetical protein